MRHIYKDGTYYAWRWADGERIVPAGWELREGPIPPPPAPQPDPRDKKIADLEAALAAMDARVKDIEAKGVKG
jgi:hypothetical protein